MIFTVLPKSVVSFRRVAVQYMLAPNMYSVLDYVISLFVKDKSLFQGFCFLINNPVIYAISISVLKLFL